LKIDSLKIHRIINAEDQHFAELWEIYSESFPLNERRTFEQQTDIFNRTQYKVDVYLSDNHVVGFIAFWTTKDFIYIEHFAIAPEVRSKGLGSAILKPFITSKEIPVILEIEPPVDDLTRRRLRFYESLGFMKNNHNHFQPPYHQGDLPLQLIILSYPNQFNADLYFQFSKFQKNTVIKIH